MLTSPTKGHQTLKKKDYNKTLLTLFTVLWMKLKPIYFYNLHNALYLPLLAYKKPSSMQSITYLERKTVLLRNCSTKAILPWSTARELGKDGSCGASLLGTLQGSGAQAAQASGAPGLQVLQRLRSYPGTGSSVAPLAPPGRLHSVRSHRSLPASAREGSQCKQQRGLAELEHRILIYELNKNTSLILALLFF